MRAFSAMIAVALVLGVSASAAVAPSGPPTSTGTGGAAASVERLATQAAIDELKAGGNAIDAAVVAAGVLGVTEPFSCGIGGGGFMVIRTADGRVTTIDGRETAPAAMTPTSFWANGVPLPFNDARWSGLSVGVPGTVATWQEALENYGTITLGEALQAGMRVARDGFVVDQTFFDQTQAAVPCFDDIPATAALFLDPDGTPHDVGTVFRNPDLARAYERIAHLGPKGLYRGAIADAIVDTARHPNPAPTADHVWRPGVMTMRDLHDYAAPEREPTHASYRGARLGRGPGQAPGAVVRGREPRGARRLGVVAGERLEVGPPRPATLRQRREDAVQDEAQRACRLELVVVDGRRPAADQAQPPAPAGEVAGDEQCVRARRQRLARGRPVDAVGEVQAQRAAPELDRLGSDPCVVCLTANSRKKVRYPRCTSTAT